MADYDDGNFYDGTPKFLILQLYSIFSSLFHISNQISNDISIDVDEGVITVDKKQPQKSIAVVGRFEPRPPNISHYGGMLMKGSSRIQSPNTSTIAQSGELQKIDSQ